MVVSSAYMRLLICLLAILIPACTSSSPEFLMMYYVYKLNNPGDNIHPWHTPFPIWNQFVVPCPVVTAASWPPYRFLKGQAGQVVWYSHLFQNISVYCDQHSQRLLHSQKNRPGVRINLHNSFRWDFHKFSLFFFTLSSQMKFNYYFIHKCPFISQFWHNFFFFLTFHS